MKTNTPKEFLGIEFLRFLCAFAILIWHYQHFFYINPGLPPETFVRSAQPFFLILKSFYLQGWYAVQFFWTISGFIFFWKYGKLIYEAKLSAKDFFLLRFSRLYPLNFITLVIVAVLQAIFHFNHGKYFVYPHNDFYHFILNILFISGWGFSHGASFNAPIWSVSAEIIAYAAFFLITLFVRPALWSTLSLTCLFFVLSKSFSFCPELTECIALFFLGGGMFLFYGNLLRARTGLRKAFIVPIIGMVILSSVGNMGAWSGLRVLNIPVFPHLSNWVFTSSTILAFVLLFDEWSGKSRIRRLASLANLTYASYLIHFPIQLIFVLVTDHFGVARSIYYHPAIFALFILCVFFLSFFAFWYFETKAQNALRGFLIKPHGDKNSV